MNSYLTNYVFTVKLRCVNSFIKLEFVDEVAFGDRFDGISGLSFFKDFFDVVRKAERRACWFVDGAFFKYVFYSDSSST